MTNPTFAAEMKAVRYRPRRAVCALPGCGEPFRKTSPAMRYCCDRHRRIAAYGWRRCRFCDEPFVPTDHAHSAEFCSRAHYHLARALAAGVGAAVGAALSRAPVGDHV